MFQNRQPSWTVAADAPQDLNLAIYVACALGIVPDRAPFVREQLWSAATSEVSTDEQAVLAEQWQVWWENIVQDRFHNRLAGRWSKYYAPNGNFQEKDVDAPLRHHCQALFPSFIAWWGHTAGGQQGVNYWAKQMEIYPLIKQVNIELHRPMNPFQFMVDYVYTGLQGPYEVDSTYAIMSVHRPFDTALNQEWWMAKIRELG